MAKPKAQRTHEFTIRVVFDKAVSRAVAKKEAHGSLVGFSDWTQNDCPAGTMKVTALKPVQILPPQPNVMADVVSVRDGGNAITLHFAEIKSAKAFRDTFPAELVRPSPSDHVVWEETAPAREYVDTLKQEIERLRAIAIDIQAGYVEATERAEEAVKAANALQVEVDRLRAAPSPQPNVAGIEEGIERAARYVEKQRDDYVQEFGMYDPSTGVTEFSTAGEEHLSTLEELIDGIRSLHETPTPPGNQIRTAECDGKDAVPVTGQLPVGTASPQSHVMVDVDAKALKAVENIFADLRDRRFLKWLFDRDGDANLIGRFDNGEELRGIDLEAQAEIKADWQAIIAKALSSKEGKDNG